MAEQGFEAFVVVGEKKGEKKELEGGLKERIEVHSYDTQKSLKRKRNNGQCEYPGCGEKRLHMFEWHHHFKTLPADQRGGEKVGGSMYRKISTFTPSDNPNKLEAYAIQMQKCTLLCTPHHTHTHTHYPDQYMRLNQHLVQQRAKQFALLVQQHGVEKALKAMREIRKLGQAP
jgi:hypothetical protein